MSESNLSNRILSADIFPRKHVEVLTTFDVREAVTELAQHLQNYANGTTSDEIFYETLLRKIFGPQLVGDKT